MSKARGGLGRGLNALIPTSTPIPSSKPAENPVDADSEATPGVNQTETTATRSADGNGAMPQTRHAEPRKTGLLTVPITSIAPNPYQPRKHIDPEVLQELADSIRVHGLVQPPVVSYNPDYDENAEKNGAEETEVDENGIRKERRARYLLIAGERRWQAAKLVGLTAIPVVVKETTPLQMLELALVENIQRADLNPLEEATAYKQLVDEFKLTQEQVAEKVGKSRTAVTNSLRLLDLSAEVLNALSDGQITEGHARALLMAKRSEDRLRLLNQIISKELSVRQTEELARRMNAASLVGQALRELEQSQQASAAVRVSERETRELEEQIRNALGTRVELSRNNKGAGKIVIQFTSDDELEGVYRRIVGDFEI